jgi:hypothetical protein
MSTNKAIYVNIPLNCKCVFMIIRPFPFKALVFTVAAGSTYGIPYKVSLCYTSSQFIRYCFSHYFSRPVIPSHQDKDYRLLLILRTIAFFSLCCPTRWHFGQARKFIAKSSISFLTSLSRHDARAFPYSALHCMTPSTLQSFLSTGVPKCPVLSYL